jgi:hypothetical protein
MMFGEPINRHLVQDSAYFDPEAIAKCEHPNLRSFTFTDESTITLCPDCGFQSGQAVLRRPTPWKYA